MKKKNDDFKDPPYPEKVTNMGPKCSPNAPHIDPMATKELSEASRRARMEQTWKHVPRKHQKHNVLASEREVRSRLEHCRKNVSQLLGTQDKQPQVQHKCWPFVCMSEQLLWSSAAPGGATLTMSTE